MKNFAQLNENNIVVNIITANNDFNLERFVEYTDENPAYIGGDLVDGFFYSPQPYASWTRSAGLWVAPVPYPQDGVSYEWNESTLEWDEILLD
jgi:hypothetical protein